MLPFCIAALSMVETRKLIGQVSVEMRNYGMVSKCCVFIVDNVSVSFNPLYKRFDWHIRHCSAVLGTWFCKNTHQIVKGMEI
jgi:hypothetical protein